MKELPRVVAVSAAFFSTASLSAQSSADSGEDIFVLSPFEVNAAEDGLYTATDSITGTRVASSIKELPYNVNVVLSEQMEDFAAFSLEEQFGHVSSFGSSEVEGQYTMRGLVADQQLRNGFQRFGLIDKINVSRVEVIKGPAAAIYGQTRPGGVINVVTKMPSHRPEQRVSVSAGNMNLYRAEFSTTGPLGDRDTAKTFYRFDAATYGQDYTMDFRDIDQTMGSFVLSHEFDKTSKLTFEAEYLKRDMNRGDIAPLEREGGVYTGFAVDNNPAFRHFNSAGPDAFTNREITTYTLSYDAKLNDVWSLRSSANYFYRGFYVLRNSGSTWDPVNERMGTRRPDYGDIYAVGKAAQIDLLANFHVGETEHRSLFTLDYNDNRDTRWNRRLPRGRSSDKHTVDYGDTVPNWETNRNLDTFPMELLPEGRTEPVVRYLYPLEEDGVDYFLLPYDPSVYTRITRDLENLRETKGLNFNHQIAFPGRKFIVSAGVRYDQVDFDLNDKLSGNHVIYSVDSLTARGGFNYSLNEDVVLYANVAESFTPQATLGNDGEILDNETGFGKEVGFKTSLFDEKLNFTLGLFDVSRENVSVTVSEVDPEDPEAYISFKDTIGEVRSEGVELDLSVNLNDALQITGGIGYADSSVVNNGNDLDAVGRRSRRVSDLTAGIKAKYSIREGKYKGLSFTFGMRHSGEAPIYDPTIGGIADDDGLIVDNDGRREILVPSYTTYDAGVMYRWKGDEKLSHRIQLNVKNVFNKEYMTTSGYDGEAINFILRYEAAWK